MVEIVRALYAPRGMLILQRPHQKRSGGLWSLPGGKVDGGEDLDDALEREFGEETGLRIGSRTLFRSTEVYDPREGLICSTYVIVEASGTIETNGESINHAFVTPRSRAGYNFAFGHGWVIENYFDRFGVR